MGSPQRPVIICYVTGPMPFLVSRKSLCVFPSVIFAPTELKVRSRVSTLNVTWHPSPNHTLVSGYKLSYREVEAEESGHGGRPTQTHTIRLRKKARFHLLTGLGEFGQRPLLLFLHNFKSRRAHKCVID